MAFFNVTLAKAEVVWELRSVAQLLNRRHLGIAPDPSVVGTEG